MTEHYPRIFLCTPNNVNVEGTISEDGNVSNSKASRSKKEKESSEEDFF